MSVGHGSWVRSGRGRCLNTASSRGGMRNEKKKGTVVR